MAVAGDAVVEAAMLILVGTVQTGVKVKGTCNICHNSAVGIPLNAVCNLDMHKLQRFLCIGVYAAADNGANPVAFQKGSKGRMTVNIRICNFCLHWPRTFYCINFELLCTAEMVEYIPVFVWYCYFHKNGLL